MTAEELQFMLDRDWKVTTLSNRWLTVWGHSGLATVDLRERCWRAGGQVTHGRSANGVKYVGRAWKRRMVDDIVTWIEREPRRARTP